MMSLVQIEAESRRAARRSAVAHQTPLVVSVPSEVFGAPFIGDRVPRGWRVLRYTDLTEDAHVDIPVTADRRGFYGDSDKLGILLFVDSSGWGGPNEPALGKEDVERAVSDILTLTPPYMTVGFAIYECGQFQAHLRVFVKREALT